MREIMQLIQDSDLEKKSGLWSVFDRLGCALGWKIGTAIDNLFSSVQQTINHNKEKDL